MPIGGRSQSAWLIFEGSRLRAPGEKKCSRYIPLLSSQTISGPEPCWNDVGHVKDYVDHSKINYNYASQCGVELILSYSISKIWLWIVKISNFTATYKSWFVCFSEIIQDETDSWKIHNFVYRCGTKSHSNFASGPCKPERDFSRLEASTILSFSCDMAWV